MPQANVTINVRYANSKSAVLELKGEITPSAENALMDAYTEASAACARVIVLNFSDLDYMNSAGIGLLVMLLIRANRQGQQLLACGLSEHYRHIFELTRLNEAICICDTEAEALATAIQRMKDWSEDANM